MGWKSKVPTQGLDDTAIIAGDEYSTNFTEQGKKVYNTTKASVIYL